MADAWIIKKTGEVRLPRADQEYYLAKQGHIQWSGGLCLDPREILSITPLPTREEMEKTLAVMAEIG